MFGEHLLELREAFFLSVYSPPIKLAVSIY